MIRRLLSPWTSLSTWLHLVHVVVGVPVAFVLSVPQAVLIAATAALLVAAPLAVVPVSAMLVHARLAGRLERSRFAALEGLELADPVPPLPPGSWWARTRSLYLSAPRWKEVAYCVARLPVSVVTASVVLVCWCGSLALMLLPTYLPRLPSRAAQVAGVEVSSAPALVVAAIAGLFLFTIVAPWATIAAGRIDRAFACWLLAPPAQVALAARVARAETGRTAAIDAAEAERRRIERDLHDGAQQRLVALAMDLGAARERLDADPEGAKRLVAEAHDEAKAALRELRDLVRGIHPVILEDRGLDAALSAVVARSVVPVELTVELPARLPTAIESAAYFVVSEALANVARHAGATKAAVAVVRASDRLVVEIRDDGAGGADPAKGTGLAGLADRVTALGGTMDLLSPPGGPTTLLVELPCAS